MVGNPDTFFVPGPETPLDDPSLYINRELSWLAFNRRVLEEAEDQTVPLLERLKFLAITESNLDEFFMVRVGGLQQKLYAGVSYGSGADHLPVRVQVEEIGRVVRQMNADTHRCLTREILPKLEAEGISIRRLDQIDEADRAKLAEVFRTQIFQVLTPLAIDPGHPFPRLLNKSLNLAVRLARPSGGKMFALVQVPSVLPRFIALPARPTGPRNAFLPLEDLIRLHLPELFPGLNIEHVSAFRITRDSDLEIDNDEVEDLLKAVEEQIRKRKQGMAVRLQLEAGAPEETESFLGQALDLDTHDVHRTEGLIDLTGLFQIHALPGYNHLRDPIFVPHPARAFEDHQSTFEAIRAGDILLHHPYETFSHVVDFIEEAARDERVLAIKQTLYRTSSDSAIVKALQRAADNGKQVTVVMEIKARLDEERNIVWARELEKAGAHVVFGFVGLKTHCKVALVVRREEDGIRRYVHLSTGNYNPQTARLYTDLGYFTCREDYCEDASLLFNYLTGYCEPPKWNKLVVAPTHLQPFMLDRIEQEIRHQREGRGGRIIAKINGLLEPAMVQALYRASQSGVKTDIICRGICSLRPGIPGISENIRVISVIDRFLEHSRIFYFGNGGDPTVHVGSADWMDRNLSRRVEVVFPVEEPALKHRVIHEVLEITRSDNVKARLLLPSGEYRRVKTTTPRVRSQEQFLLLADPARHAPAPDSSPRLAAPPPKSHPADPAKPRAAKTPRKPPAS